MNRLLRRGEVREVSRPGARVTTQDNTLGGPDLRYPPGPWRLSRPAQGWGQGGGQTVEFRELPVDRFFLDVRYIRGVRCPPPQDLGGSPMLSEIRPPKVGKWTEPALRVLRERYLLRNERGEVIETPEEMCWRVAQSIAA